MNNFDLIGDIHGHADELEALLKKMGYSKSAGVYSHPERRALFVGDYIDRGPEIKRTLEIVRGMVEKETAIALMGNHEYNALCFHHEEREGGHLRPHSIKNILQHYETLEQFKNKQGDYENYLKWFLELPLYYENDSFRAVHATWDPFYIKSLDGFLKAGKLTEELLHDSVVMESVLYQAIEVTLKGKEVVLPDGYVIKDKEDFERKEIRIRWWRNPRNKTYRDLAIHPNEDVPDDEIPHESFLNDDYYREGEKPVFFGHYWLKGEPKLFRCNICCLDYSIAKKGRLVAYRFDGESVLKDENFVVI
jgi:hypothetical protein